MGLVVVHHRWAGSSTGTFVLGTTEPVGGVNVGAGVIAAYPTTNIPIGGAVSYNSSNGVYTITSGTWENYVIPGFAECSADVVLRNCAIIGTVTEQTSERQLVKGPTTSGQMTLEYCTVDPQTPSAYYNGISQGVKAVRSWIKNTTDGIKAYSTSSNGARIRCEGVLIDQLTQFAPDYAASRTETHNDCIQTHHFLDTVELVGCKLNGRHSLTKGDIPPYRAQIAAVMCTVISGGEFRLTLDQCWLLGGIYCVNAGSDSVEMADSYLTITNSRFERPGTDQFGDGRAPSIALVVDNSLNFTGSGNTYIDNGQPVPVTPG